MGEPLLPTPSSALTERKATVKKARGRTPADPQVGLADALALLPTPSSADGMGGHLTRGGERSNEKLLPGVAQALTSASSRESEDSTSPSRPSATDASDRSRSTSGAVPSSEDTGQMFPVGEMSPTSPLLPTPIVGEPHAPAQATGIAERRASLTDVLTSSVEDFLVSPSPTPASGRDAPTPGGSGPSTPVWLASYDPEQSSWRTSQVSFLSTEDERFPRWWETWPRWAMWDATGLYALPMSALPTDGSGSSSLPTPRISDANGAGAHGTGGPDLRTALTLPTPSATDWKGSSQPGQRRGQLSEVETGLLPTPRHEGFDAGNHRGQPDGLPQTIKGLLPTPTADDSKSGRNATATRKPESKHHEGTTLTDWARLAGDHTNPPSEDGSG